MNKKNLYLIIGGAVLAIAIVVALIFGGNIMTLAYSVAGAVLSLALMTLFKKMNLFLLSLKFLK